MQVPEKIGGQGRNRTNDTRIFRESNGPDVSPCPALPDSPAFCCQFAVIFGADPTPAAGFAPELATSMTSDTSSGAP